MSKQPQSSDFFSNRKILILILIGISALARAAFLSAAAGTFLWNGIWSDAATYNQWARRIVVNNDWIGDTPFFMSPLYPYFLALIYSVFGESLTAVRIIQGLIGITTVLLIFLITERLFSRKAAFFSGLLAAFYGPFVLSNALLLVETLKVLLLLLACLLMLHAVRGGRGRLWLGAGISLGLAVLCRPTDLLAVPIAGIALFAFDTESRRRRFISFGIFLTGLILVIAPVTIRNYAVSGEFIPITSNGGLNFYLGNNPKAVGVYYNVDRLDLANDPDGRVYLESQLGRTLRHSETSAIWFARSLDFVTGDFLSFAELLAKKTLLVFHHKEISQLGYNYVFVEKFAVPFLSWLPAFLFAGTLGILGMVFASGRGRDLLVPYGFAAAQLAGIILFFVTDRFRLSLVPFLIVFAGFGFTYLLEQVRRRSGRNIGRVVVVAGVSLLGMTVLNVDIEDEFSMEWEHVGMLYFNSRPPDLVARAAQGDQVAARELQENFYKPSLRAYQEAGMYKDSYHVRNNVGNLMIAMGRFDQAMEQYRIGHSMNSRQAVSTFSMGTAHVTRQDWVAALESFDEAIRINPRFAPAYLNRGLVLYYLQRFEEALDSMKKYTELERDASKLATVRQDIRNLERLVGSRSIAPPPE